MRLPPLPRRLPGVLFEVPPPDLDEALPRMDIAFFAGFAGRGPLERAMAVESLAEFEAIYGSAMTLARNPGDGTAVNGLLHPCVRSFFGQGGRRCWILRVAGPHAEWSRFEVPGLLRATLDSQEWQHAPADLRASSVGSGADTLRLSARLSERLLRVEPVDWQGDRLVLAASAAVPTDLRAGDLLRIDWDRVRLHARVETVVQAGADCAITLGAFHALQAASASPALQVVQLGRDPSEAAAVLHSPPGIDAQWLDDGGLRVRSWRSAPWPQPGQVLPLQFWPDGKGWMALEQVAFLSAPDPHGRAELQLLGRPWLEADAGDLLHAWAATDGQRVVRRIRVDLACGEAGGAAQRAQDLPLAAAAGETDLRLSDPLRFPLVGDRVAEGTTALWIPLADLAGVDAALGARHSARTALERDGLEDFNAELFVEPALRDLPADVLAEQAQALRLAGRVPQPLRGLHALLGGSPEALYDEPTLLAVPDAVHAGWERSPAAPAWQLLDPLPEPADPCAGAPFGECVADPPPPEPVQGPDPDAAGTFTLYWTEADPAARYALAEAADEDFAAASVVYEGAATRFTVLRKPPGEVFYRVRATVGTRRSAWSRRVRIGVGRSDHVAREWRSDTLLDTHGAMLRCAAARGDLLAVLALPEHFDTAAAADHAAQLRARANEPRTLSHGALYHPWILIGRDRQILRFPPDGAACGQLAIVALRRGAWRAAANAPLRDVVALTPPGMAASPAQRQQLLDAQVNLLRNAPHGFVFSSADTLTDDSAWRPINVRRLMSLLRRLALLRGTTYVFEPNGPALRRTVERGFTAVLDGLFRRGAFAGAQASDAYRVEAGGEVNTPQRRDAGQFWVDLKVAPALPLSFLTVRLVREGERVVSRELH